MWRKINKKIKNLFATVAAFFVGISFIVSASSPRPVLAFAASSTYLTDYDKTDIMEDLAEVIDATEYPENAQGFPEIILMQEYLYSEKIFFADYYGLYLYIYNPTENPIAGTNCKVNMATTYNEKGEPASFSNKTLKFLDKTENDRFYKFKIAGTEILKAAKGYAALHNGTRRYDFADITLNYADGTTLDTSSLNRRFSNTYYFKGYAQGVSDESSIVSTLESETQELETITLNVNHANYRTGDVKDYVQDELNTVYFSVDERYFTEYGSLQKIKSEWYEYKTKPIFVTSESGAYAALYDYIGKNIGEVDEALRYRILWEEKNYDRALAGFTLIAREWDKNYNGKMGEITSNLNQDFSLSKNSQALSRLDWLFDVGEVQTLEDYKISASSIENYMSWYTGHFSDQKKLNGYAEGLFEASIDEDRRALLKNPDGLRGYIEQEIDAKDEQGLLVEKKQSWWDKLWHGTKYETEQINPIVVLKSEDLEGLTAETFGEKYLISKEYNEACFDYCKEQTGNGKRAVLFRFAVTDYYTSTARFDYENDVMSDPDGYVAQETVFLDYKVISLSFKDEREDLTVIGVVSTPIDIINGVEPDQNATELLPIESWDWGGLFSSVGSVLGVVLGLVVVFFLVYFLGKYLIVIIMALMKKR